ncbi:ECF transporter S component [Subtercola sp. RTI3]|uniref:ECF transporter S component n=1 Tax=Subtercola sp. RTI3 TaxID=3048639 RepID=UPI002B229717|nr:ECF transporter S component [Subtercola sp. RTI3]MEA9986183.1 ECF transporter S component [Subtercola sp. RTI3]
MQTTTATIGVSAARSSLGRWRVVDIIVASVIGVAAGLIFWAWGLAYNPIGTPLEAALPGLQGLVNGGWLFAGVLGALVIRKPGAALYTELVAAIVSALIGTQWGPWTLVSGLTQGIGAEIVFALFLYSSYRLGVALLAGVGAAVALSITDLIVSYPGSDTPFIIIYTVTSIISGVVIAGLLSWLAMRGIARTGALSRFASGRESAVRV